GECKDEYNACIDCTPNCVGKQCGDDGCGGSCGTCPGGAACNEYGLCPCQPKCTGKQCGSDGCGGLCGTCLEPFVCNASGQCVCVPNCKDKECGPDGCSGTCGKCPDNWKCELGKCVSPCKPQCEGKECGDDGCGGLCGKCPEGHECFNGICQFNQGCFGFCGTASPQGCYCDDLCFQYGDCCENVCEACPDLPGCGTCVPNCYGKQCGDDGCGGSCGYCPPGYYCDGYNCVTSSGKKCVEILECVLSCPYLSQECLGQCMSGASESSQQLFIQLAQCIVQNCGLPPSNSCVNKAISGPCVKQYEQCKNDF
ncbi:MAG: hypothetical protein FJ088_07555, partial [Deltaproteobacteria bacterium]|nr:hypothetical protein [Deltaproteobacteria bacterium]